ncbi:hypothetical protein Dimus_020328, partial [Dionaea muscipula]
EGGEGRLAAARSAKNLQRKGDQRSQGGKKINLRGFDLPYRGVAHEFKKVTLEARSGAAGSIGQQQRLRQLRAVVAASRGASTSGSVGISKADPRRSSSPATSRSD